jgi:hypothetical protein
MAVIRDLRGGRNLQESIPLQGTPERRALPRPSALRRAWRAVSVFLERLNGSQAVNEIHRADFDQLLRSTFD